MRSVILAAALATAAAAQNLSLTRNGRYLADSTGARYVIRGVAYQPQGNIAAATAENSANGGFPEPDSYVDALADAAACQRDIPNLTALGANTIRSYSINPYNDHSGCLTAFAAAGIRVIVDLPLPQNGSINRASPSWDVSLLQEYMTTIDTLAPYNAIVAVNVANEVVTQASNSIASAFIKAAARDTRAYLRSKGLPWLVGYSSADGSPWRTELANYLTCGDPANQIDIFGLNSYAGCGATSIAPYTSLNNDFATFPAVAYFSEFGCLQAGTRTWSEVEVIFGQTMLNIWSGGLAFEYFFDSQGLGLTANTTTRDGAITTNADFTRLQAQYTAVQLPTTAGTATGTTPACPSNANQLSSSNLPPTPNALECACLSATAFDCVAKPNLTPATIGALLNSGCSLLASAGGSCNAIASDGQTGVYGNFSGCAPVDKLNYVLSTYYALTNRMATSCDFGGNATVNAGAPVANQAAASSSCAAGATASVFTPSAVSTSVVVQTAAANGASGATRQPSPSSGNSGNSGNKGAAVVAMTPGSFVPALVAAGSIFAGAALGAAALL